MKLPMTMLAGERPKEVSAPTATSMSKEAKEQEKRPGVKEEPKKKKEK